MTNDHHQPQPNPEHQHHLLLTPCSLPIIIGNVSSVPLQFSSCRYPPAVPSCCADSKLHPGGSSHGSPRFPGLKFSPPLKAKNAIPSAGVRLVIIASEIVSPSLPRTQQWDFCLGLQHCFEERCERKAALIFLIRWGCGCVAEISPEVSTRGYL